jgi:hypothetical protein
MKLINLTSKRFGKLIVIKKLKSKKWLCKCDCGAHTSVLYHNLVSGNTKSCGSGICNGRVKNLIGEKFGNLKVVSFDKIQNGSSYWICKCKCGEVKSIKRGPLIQGATTSCGNSLCNGLIRDISGKKFGKLLVIGFSHSDKNNNSYWKCKCSCGTHVVIQGAHLISKTTGSCGNTLCNKTYKDIANKRFGKLVALMPFLKSNSLYWECRCDCGELCNFLSARLLAGDVKSCGCEPVYPKLVNENRLCAIIKEIFPECKIKRNHIIRELYNKKTKRSQKIDIAIYKNNKIFFAIEYDGEQHFFPVTFGGMSKTKALDVHLNTKKRDLRKARILKKLNIPLVRFSYKDRARRRQISKQTVIDRLIKHGIISNG